jgi:hypothetical protein
MPGILGRQAGVRSRQPTASRNILWEVTPPQGVDAMTYPTLTPPLQTVMKVCRAGSRFICGP